MERVEMCLFCNHFPSILMNWNFGWVFLYDTFGVYARELRSTIIFGNVSFSNKPFLIMLHKIFWLWYMFFKTSSAELVLLSYNNHHPVINQSGLVIPSPCFDRGKHDWNVIKLGPCSHEILAGFALNHQKQS